MFKMMGKKIFTILRYDYTILLSGLLLVVIPPPKSDGYSLGVVRLSVHTFVCPEPYLSTYWSDLIHSWHK